MHLVCDPNPFCFGSISALRAIASHLPAEVRLTVLATGPVLDLVDERMTVVPCDVKDPRDIAIRLDQLGRVDGYLAISNNANVPLVVERGVPLVFVDILFWMKRSETLAMREARVYLVEQFPGVEERLEQLPPARAECVAPLIHAGARRAAVDAPLLVNLGGASSPDLRPGSNTSYPARMTALVARIAARLELGEVLVAMGSAAAASVPASPPALVVTMGQDAYLDRLSRSRQLLTAPGLNAPFEAFRMEVPVAYLPPQNLTQVAQLDVYVRDGLASPGLNLSDLVPEVEIDARLPERDGTAAVLKALSLLDAERMAHIEDLVVRQLARPPAELEVLIERQSSWLLGLGEDGAAHAARRIVEVLA